MPPRENATILSWKLYFKESDGSYIEVSATPIEIQELEQGTKTAMSMIYEPTTEIKIKSAFQLQEATLAVLFGMKVKEYRRWKKLWHIAHHSKKARIRKKALKELLSNQRRHA